MRSIILILALGILSIFDKSIIIEFVLIFGGLGLLMFITQLVFFEVNRLIYCRDMDKKEYWEEVWKYMGEKQE